MYKILVTEDEELIATMLRLNLEREGYETEVFRDAESALARLATERFDLILMDIMLPGISGEEALASLRKRGIATPVIMLTAKREVETKVAAFASGADDYLTKPFDMDELLARVQAIIRRSQGNRSLHSSRIISIGRFDVNLETRLAQTNEGTTTLSEKEANLLSVFAQSPGKTLSRADILEEVWGMDVDPTLRTIDNFVVKFRKLFEANPERPKHFITVRSIGYRFEP
jgi:two-component system alkaline phosphatase synthesis response regulator PhoP